MERDGVGRVPARKLIGTTLSKGGGVGRGGQGKAKKRYGGRGNYSLFELLLAARTQRFVGVVVQRRGRLGRVEEQHKGGGEALCRCQAETEVHGAR